MSAQASENIEKLYLQNSIRIDCNYRFGDQVFLINKVAYKYKTPFTFLYKIYQMTVTLQMGEVKNRGNINYIKPYKKKET